MPKVLTQAQIDEFHEQGFVSPIRVMSAAEALGYRSRLERFERETGGSLGGDLRHKTHLLFTWLADLVRHSRILDAVEDLYGPDLLCWTTNFFIKEKANPAFVSWHQDSTYWGLSQPDVVTAWVAFTLANCSAAIWIGSGRQSGWESGVAALASLSQCDCRARGDRRFRCRGATIRRWPRLSR